MEYIHAAHGFGAYFNDDSSILILGSFPSVKSREANFYYAHPQNRFWRVLASLFGRDTPVTLDEKKKLLLENKIALWDVIDECDISGSSDASIKNVTVNDVPALLNRTSVQRIFTNGATTYKLYNKYLLALSGIAAQLLPSTSPANAACSLEMLVEKWGEAFFAKNGE